MEVNTPAGSTIDVDIQGAANTVIKISLLNDGVDDDVARDGVQTNAVGLIFQHNKVSGYSAGPYVNSGATGDVSGNTFEGDGSGAVLDTSGVKFHGNTLTESGGADVALDVGAGFATTSGDNVDVSQFIYGNSYSQRATAGDRAVSIVPKENDITVTGTDGNDRLRDDADGGRTGITFIGGAGTDSINSTFADLNSDKFSDIQSGEYITVRDSGDVTASLSNGDLILTNGTGPGSTSVVDLNGANGTVAVTYAGDTSTITYTAANTRV